MKSKKGMALPIETIIIMIIAIVVLTLILLFVTGKWTDLTGTLGGLESGVSEGATESVEQIFE